MQHDVVLQQIIVQNPIMVYYVHDVHECPCHFHTFFPLLFRHLGHYMASKLFWLSCDHGQSFRPCDKIHVYRAIKGDRKWLGPMHVLFQMGRFSIRGESTLLGAQNCFHIVLFSKGVHV